MEAEKQENVDVVSRLREEREKRMKEVREIEEKIIAINVKEADNIALKINQVKEERNELLRSLNVHQINDYEKQITALANQEQALREEFQPKGEKK